MRVSDLIGFRLQLVTAETDAATVEVAALKNEFQIQF
jgi:hypothetical protein